MGVEEEYGPPPPGMERPESPDFDLLVEIVNKIDTEADSKGKGFDLGDYAGQFIDISSLSYMALQRAIRVLGLKSPQEVHQHLDIVMRVSAAYLEACVVGIQFEQRRHW